MRETARDSRSEGGAERERRWETAVLPALRDSSEGREKQNVREKRKKRWREAGWSFRADKTSFLVGSDPLEWLEN